MSARRALVAFAVVAVLAAPTALAELVETEAKIKNREPSITSIVPLDDEPGAAGYQVQPVAGGAKTVTVSLTTEDGNGKEDIRSLTFQVTRPDGSVLHDSVTASESNAQGMAKSFTASFPVGFYEPPGTYAISAAVVDSKGGRGSATQAFDYQELLAFDPTPRAVEFASADLEPATSSPVAGISVRNLGNVPLDVQVSGTPMAARDADARIGVDRVKFGLEQDLSDASPLGLDPETLAAFDLAPGADARRGVYFRVDVPSGEDQFIPADTYQGSVTIGAEVSS